MRLNPYEIETIRRYIEEHFGKARIFIFGSRLDETRRGGDVDIFVIPQKMPANIRVARGCARLYIEEALLKPVDIIVHRDFSRKIEQEALRGVEITATSA